MNRVNLIGRITNTPELRYTINEIAFTRFNIAINQGYGDNKKTDFIPIIVWRKQAENVCNYLDKGSLIAVEGRLQTGVYEDKEGNKKTTFDVVAESVEFLESKKDGQAVQAKPAFTVDEVDSMRINDDPFADFGEQISLDDSDLD
jgi:single-strand DNA-binding protein